VLPEYELPSFYFCSPFLYLRSSSIGFGAGFGVTLLLWFLVLLAVSGLMGIQ